MSIKAIDKSSIHRITSGQVVVDLQTAVKELLENSVDAGATNVEVRFKNFGLTSIEVVDNGSGIPENDHDSIALKHHTSKLETYSDLSSIHTFGFRGEALSSLCALSEKVSICTATSETAPVGVSLTMDSSGRVKKRSTVARNKGTTITLSHLFTPLAVRRKEFERNAKREFGKALSLLNAYALGPCAAAPGIRLTVSNQPDKGTKTTQIQTFGSPSCRASVTALWGPKALENIVDMDISFEVERERTAIKRIQSQDSSPISIHLKGLISKFSVGCGRTGTDRQFFYINGRPCNMNKVQKAFNEVYRTFNANQAPFILADFLIPTESYDVNVSPDKRTILIHSEANLISALKTALENHFSPSRSTFDLGGTQGRPKTQTQTLLTQHATTVSTTPRVTRRSQKTVDDTDDRSSPSNVHPDRPSSPAAPLFLPSPPPQARVSSPEDLPRHHHQASSSKLPPAGDEGSMDIDGDDAPHSEPEEMVLDPSQTSWGRQLGISSPMRPITPSSSKAKSSEPTDDEDGGHPRKKRKSDVSSMAGSGSAVRDSEAAGPGRKPSDKPTKLTQLPLPGAPTKAKDPRKNLRSQIAGFARSGSQLQPRALSSSGDERDDLDVDEPLNMEEEVPDEDMLEMKEMEEDVGKRSDATPSTPIRYNRTRRPSSEAGSPTSHDTGPVDIPISALSDDYETDGDPNSVLSQALASSYEEPSITPQKNKIHRPEIIRTEKDDGDLLLRFDFEHVGSVWSRKKKDQRLPSLAAGSAEGVVVEPERVPSEAGVSNTENDAKAADALARVIEKNDFESMAVVGQFNLGFIVIRRARATEEGGVGGASASTRRVADDLFIVDQHAADEKYNFETLQATTKIESQKLFRPQPLELTASDEMVALENINVLQQNGFEIDVEAEASIGQGSKLKLTAQPVSKNTTFDMKGGLNER
ncbi:hypothetical protein M413DRAFT_371356 [Hebeloma cylindrosporum]|uniref:DNA mismatch repair protein S5 domain-containing protein n=1 Tax=Hebeloma cylindrosporum TaxID=76867 RepID=A0A0C3C4X9_HEBCY|nr:hypothetical protein M413DRAFT_371356 [Hebeloma cylindrosporum h7]